jgi:hypothetical protein
MNPRPELTASDGETVIMFVRSTCIAYLNESADPIFPAKAPFAVGPGDNVWFNSMPHATVLGCTEMAEIRDPQTRQVWNIVASNAGETPMLSTNLPMRKFLNVMLLAIGMAFSNIGSAVTARPGKINVVWCLLTFEGSRFDAQSKLAWRLSGSLSSDQWRVEVRQIFEASLARMQLEVVDAVRGELKYQSDGRIAKNLMQANETGMCNMVKFQSIGWKNLSLFWLLTLPTLGFLLWILTMELKNQSEDANEEQTEIVLTWLIREQIPRLWILLLWLSKRVVLPALHSFWVAIKKWGLVLRHLIR